MALTKPSVATLLQPRQLSVLIAIQSGMSNGQIAEQMQISIYGAKDHVRRLLKKYGVSKREELRRVKIITGNLCSDGWRSYRPTWGVLPEADCGGTDSEPALTSETSQSLSSPRSLPEQDPSRFC
jgi:DNA-binding CsgD family transcriptional regulator